METEVMECRASANPNKARAGIGMPTSLYLQEFGEVLFLLFGEVPYQVGSSVTSPTWRDVDIRIMLDAKDYAVRKLGDPKRPHDNPRWCALVKALSLLGREMTKLPIDFQIQEITTANEEFTGPRNALVTGSIRRQELEK